jgi:hypothetical protein
MKDRAQEEAYLVLANSHIAEAEETIRRVTRQLNELAAIQEDADARAVARKTEFLSLLTDGLGIMYRHREQILDALNESNQGT